MSKLVNKLYFLYFIGVIITSTAVVMMYAVTISLAIGIYGKMMNQMSN